MTTDQPEAVADPAAARQRSSTARRRSLLAAGIGVLAGTAALLVPSTTSVAVTTHSPPATTTTTLPPCPDWNPWRYINTTRNATISQWVSHYERCNPTTRKTEHGCYLHG